MVIAFLLINAEASAEADVLKDMKGIKEVREATLVYGVYDIIARIETDTMEELKNISRRVRYLNKVRSTLTMIVV